MDFGVIATWRMALDGIKFIEEDLKDGMKSGDVVENLIKVVEDYPFFKSVGYGGLPNEFCEVELDAGFMDGNTLSVGAIGGIKDFKNPISIARKLSFEEVNCFLVGAGAECYAHKNGFERINMLTERAKNHYKKRVNEEKMISPYNGHDTIGAIALDKNGSMSVGTSTSGLFMKQRGRIGDSPIVGSGFYVDSKIGGATATGLGEDLMKGCISYEIVRLMEQGYKPQEAGNIAINKLNNELRKRRGKIGDLSVVCMNNKGEWGVATNIKEFTFSVYTEKEKAKVYICKNKNGKTIYKEASKSWLENYEIRIKEPIIIK